MRLRALALLMVITLAGGTGPGMTTAAAARCDRDQTRKAFRAFIAAYNSGDIRALNRLFVTGERFLSYEVNPVERTNDAGDRDTLMTYFKDRHSFDDRLTLVDLNIGRNPNYPGFGVSYTLERASEEISPTGSGRFSGKGQIDCVILGLRLSWGP